MGWNSPFRYAAACAIQAAVVMCVLAHASPAHAQAGTALADEAGPVDTEAARDAIKLGLAYTGELLSNRSGGLSRDSAYVDNLDLTLAVDSEALFGWPGTEFFVYGLYNNGSPFSETIVGDLQVVSNIETGVQAVRFFEAWFRFRLGRRSEMLVGLYDLNSEFDVLDASQLFIGSAHGIGTDISQAGLNGPSIFPVSALALRISKQFNHRWTARAAVLDGVPGDPEDPKATSIRLSSDEGALLIGEVERATYTDRLLLGAWAYSAKFGADPFDLSQDEIAAKRGNFGFYVRGEKTLYVDASELSVFGRLGYAHGDFNVFDYFASAGLTWRGMLHGRPDDQIGLAFAWAETSSNVLDLADELGVGAEPREVIVELTYRAPISEMIAIQPSLHYVINPGLDPSLDNALAVGLRFELTLLD